MQDVVDGGGGCACWEEKVYGNSVCSAKFCFESKNYVKSKVYI